MEDSARGEPDGDKKDEKVNGKDGEEVRYEVVVSKIIQIWIVL